VPYAAHYAATKAYVQSLGEGLAVELASSGVDVLVSSPGPTATGFGERARMRLDRAMHPRDVARVSLDALGRSGTLLPGGLTKFLHGALATLPRAAKVRMMGRIMRGMT
jgi:short-subunit dehydrogenase